MRTCSCPFPSPVALPSASPPCRPSRPSLFSLVHNIKAIQKPPTTSHAPLPNRSALPPSPPVPQAARRTPNTLDPRPHNPLPPFLPSPLPPPLPPPFPSFYFPLSTPRSPIAPSNTTKTPLPHIPPPFLPQHTYIPSLIPNAAAKLDMHKKHTPLLLLGRQRFEEKWRLYVSDECVLVPRKQGAR